MSITVKEMADGFKKEDLIIINGVIEKCLFIDLKDRDNVCLGNDVLNDDSRKNQTNFRSKELGFKYELKENICCFFD